MNASPAHPDPTTAAAATVAAPAPVLSFDAVTIESPRAYEYDSSVWDVNLSLGPGELVLVRMEKEHTRLPLADAACGVIPPDQGAVRFEGQSWSDLAPDAAAARRGRIGRVFGDGGWVRTMPVADNVTLAQRHHTRRPPKEIEDEAVALARQFALPGLPRGLPTDVRRQDLRRAACVRALMGEPRLLLLEEPTDGVYPEIMPSLVNALRGARRRGAAVMWLTADGRVWNDAGIRPTAKYLMTGSQMTANAE